MSIGHIILALVATAIVFATLGLMLGCCLAAGAQADRCAECRLAVEISNKAERL